MAREPEKMSTFDERITWNEGDIQFVDADGNPIDPKKMKAQITEPPEDDETAGGPTLHEQATPERRKMNGRAIERRNLLILTTIAYEAGYGAYLPVVDDGIDLILCRECKTGDDLMKVQLKTRWSLNKKYEGRNIWIAFPYPPKPNQGESPVWYLARHDELIEVARKFGFGIEFYTANGEFSRGTLSKDLVSHMQRFIFPRPSTD